MKQSKATSPATLARLAKQLHDLGIAHQVVAEEASKTSKRGRVGLSTVSNVLAGRTKSANVVATVKRLIAAAKSSQSEVA
jgi:hypothetical protein